MIRFLPDTWRDTLLRPLAMAAPDGGVYIEIMAPDVRFALVAGLLVLLAGLAAWRRRTGSTPARPTLVLTAALAAALVPWLLTTGNGRYFIAGLLAVGPVCIALVWLLPVTRAARLSAAAILLGLQAFVVQQANPLQAWGLAQWKDPPFFEVDLPQDLRAEPASYVTMSTISYSLIAPSLPPSSRWINLANAPNLGSGNPDSARTQRFLSQAEPGRLLLLTPFIPGGADADGLPTPEVFRAIDDRLADYSLALSQPHQCRLVRSRGLVTMALRKESRADAGNTKHVGFWVCHLTWRLPEAPTAPAKEAPMRFDAAFAALEAGCPRFFQSGSRSVRVPGGEMRHYPEADMKAYVLDSGVVYYKYYRAFNPERVATAEELVSGAVKLDCGRIRGRSGLPWEREI